MTTDRVLTTAAKAISALMHPLIIPVYGAALLAGNAQLSSRATVLLLVITLSMTLLLPAFSIIVFKRMGVICDLSLTTRKERNLPLIVVVMSFLTAIVVMRNFMVVPLLREFLFAGVIMAWTATVVNYFWKISLHMIASGGLLALVVLLSITSFSMSTTTLCSAIMACGALASARLYLGHHNGAQVALGLGAGFTVACCTMLFI